MLVDPFNQGRFLTEDQCQELLDRVYGGSLTVQPAFLQPMEKKGIIKRDEEDHLQINLEEDDALAVGGVAVVLSRGHFDDV